MKRLLLVTLAFGFYSSNGLAANLQACDMDSAQPQIEEGIRNALVGMFQIEGQTLDKNQISIARASDMVIQEYTKTLTYQALDVTFVSPRGTAMSFRSFNTFTDTFFPSAGFTFRIEKERDAEGFLIKKECIVGYFLDLIGTTYPSVRNETNGMWAPISHNLHKHANGTTPGDLIHLTLPMELVE